MMTKASKSFDIYDIIKELKTPLISALETPGAVSATELLALAWTSYRELNNPGGSIVELGSHAGKTSLILGFVSDLMDLRGTLYLVDPLYDFLNASWHLTVYRRREMVEWEYAKGEGFVHRVSSLIASHVKSRFALVGDISINFLKSLNEPVSIAFIDSDAHTENLILEEVALLEPKLLSGALLYFHDYGNFDGPVYAVKRLLATGKYSMVRIEWGDIVSHIKDMGFESLNNTWHMVNDPYPSYLACLKRI